MGEDDLKAVLKTFEELSLKDSFERVIQHTIKEDCPKTEVPCNQPSTDSSNTESAVTDAGVSPEVHDKLSIPVTKDVTGATGTPPEMSQEEAKEASSTDEEDDDDFFKKESPYPEKKTMLAGKKFAMAMSVLLGIMTLDSAQVIQSFGHLWRVTGVKKTTGDGSDGYATLAEYVKAKAVWEHTKNQFDAIPTEDRSKIDVVLEFVPRLTHAREAFVAAEKKLMEQTGLRVSETDDTKKLVLEALHNLRVPDAGKFNLKAFEAVQVKAAPMPDGANGFAGEIEFNLKAFKAAQVKAAPMPDGANVFAGEIEKVETIAKK